MFFKSLLSSHALMKVALGLEGYKVDTIVHDLLTFHPRQMLSLLQINLSSYPIISPICKVSKAL